MFVKPTLNPETGETFKIRRPERNFTHLPDDGDEVPDNRYWRGHLKDGSIELAEPAKPAAKKADKGAD
ncbi:DUF2635 domain-containing protein [Methylomonas sp. 11b]|uniref:DUF2635 domain-containing protein n=1 Tax=Methylomonas sp. 11b TaxID=1168169 RepID=UPI000478D01B|nr:DUF2635 domain-containing protein [Methylomonas sp. 11b]